MWNKVDLLTENMGQKIMTHCWLCGASEIKSPNSKYTYYGKILGKKVQKTIRVCNCCSAMRSDEDIREEVAEIFGWDYNEEDDQMWFTYKDIENIKKLYIDGKLFEEIADVIGCTVIAIETTLKSERVL